MERELSKDIAKSREFERIQIPAPIKVVIGGLAYGIIKDGSLEDLLDDESHHEFDNNIAILN